MSFTSGFVSLYCGADDFVSIPDREISFQPPASHLILLYNFEKSIRLRIFISTFAAHLYLWGENQAMKTDLVILISVLLVAGVVAADEPYPITGKVIDNVTGLPIIGASIVIKGTSQGTASDAMGGFEIATSSGGRLTITVSAVGYRKTEREIRIDPDQTAHVEIGLDPEVIKFDQLNVTASRFVEESFRSPINVSVTLRERFLERTFSTTAEVLREEPGVLVQKTTHGHGAPVLRGLIGKHVLLLYDGIRLNRPTFRLGANQYLNTVDLMSLDRIEVARGPSSVMYGSDAMGGVVNLIPLSLPQYDSRLEILPRFSARYSSADNGISSNLHLSGNYFPMSASINLSYRNIGDLRAGGEIGRQDPTGWDEVDISARVSYSAGRKSTLYFDYLSVLQNDVPRYDKYVSGDFDQYIYDPQNRRLYALTFNAADFSSSIREAKVNISFSDEEEGRTEQKAGSATIDESTDELYTYGGYAQLATNVAAKHKLVFGSEFYHDIVKSRTFKVSDGQIENARPTYPDDSKYYSLGIFLQDNWSLSNIMELTYGIRYSSQRLKSPLEEPYGLVDETYDDITGSLSLTVKLDSSLNLVGRWSQGYYAPNLNDVTVLKTSSSGVDVPSIGLDPEKSDNFEIGMKANSSAYRGSLFAFYNRLSNLIDRTPGTYGGLTFLDENNNGVQDAGEFDVYQRKNVSRAYVVGLEYESSLRVSFAWEIRSNCFWTRGQNLTDDEPLSRIPPLMGRVAIRYYASQHNWGEIFVRAAGDQRRLSARDKDDTRIDLNGTPGWATLNFRTKLELNRIKTVISFENILDRAYKEHGSGIYSPGFNFMISLEYGII